MRQAARRPSLDRAAGFSILELVITLLVAGVALAVAAELLLIAKRHTLAEERRALDGELPLALDQVRADVTAALDALPDGAGMALLHPDGLRITYRQTGTELVRETLLPDGETSRRTVLRGVRAFAWAHHVLPGAGLPLVEPKPAVEIFITVESAGRAGALVVDGQRNIAPRDTESRALVLTLRGGGGENGW